MCKLSELLDDATIERLLSHISPEPNSGCWLWTHSLTDRGYARFKAKGQYHRVHRLTYFIFKGAFEGLEPDHVCRNRCCVNPDHLEAVTRHENMVRMLAERPKKTHCPKGHTYADNLIVRANGDTACRECERARSLRRYHARQGSKISNNVAPS